MRLRQIVSLLLLTVALVSVAGALALSQTAQPSTPPEAPPAQNPPAEKPPAQTQSKPSKSGKEKEKKKAEEGPKVVRWVCTDLICGGCDGECSHHGHVATHKDGHCACTPNPGGALDQAIRKAFEGHEKGH